MPQRFATAASPARPTAVWVCVGLVLAALGALWSAAVPLMASPDEPSHVVRAAAVARGQWSGELGEAATDASRPGAGTLVQLPSDYQTAVTLPNCIAFQPQQSADCQPDVPPAEGTTSVETFAGQYPPLYYALVGWPSLWLGAEAATYAMRLVAAALTAALLTWGAWRLTRDFPGTVLWGAAVAVTPMALFLGATVNPQGLEVAAGFAFAAACLSLTCSRSGVTTGALTQAAVTGAVLVNTRTVSPLWAVAILAVALVAGERGRLAAVVRHPASPWVAGGAVIAAAAAVGWLLTHPGVVTASGLRPELTNPLRVAAGVLRQWWAYLSNMIGDFGWLDTPVPPSTVLAWSVAGGALVLAASTARGQRRRRGALLLLVLGVAAAPLALQLPTASDTGLTWQGRYALPLAVMVPLLAAIVVSGADADQAGTRRTARVAVVVVGAGHVGAFLAAAHRYAVGADGELLTLSPAWSSPVGYLGAVLGPAVLVAALGSIVWRAAGDSGPEPVR